MRAVAALTEQAVEEALHELPGWALREGKLHRELTFPDFIAAFGFMSSMALVSEAHRHHPDWWNSYQRVVIDLWSHDAGGITERDLRWAKVASERLRALGL